MSFKVEIVADSDNGYGNRITTMVVTFPRIILSEMNTHRMFSRNSASSRAIPFEKMINSLRDNPFVPIAYQKNHKGMQGTEYLTGREAEVAESAWHAWRNQILNQAAYFGSLGVTKQLVNRPLEAFMWHTAIVTATEWENFFALRCPQYVIYTGANNPDRKEVYRSKKDLLKSLEDLPKIQEAVANRTELEWLQQNEGQAEIHMMKIAEMMWDAYNESTPKQLKPGEWHIPYLDKIEADEHRIFDELNLTPYFDQYYSSREKTLVKISTVMNARTSYTVVGEDQKPMSYPKMILLHDNMRDAEPKHMSPFEHCAMNPLLSDYNGRKPSDFWSGNFRGWIQYRKTIEGENITK